MQSTGNASNAVVTAPGITTVTNGAAVVMFGMVGDNDGLTLLGCYISASLTELYDANLNSTIDEAFGNGVLNLCRRNWQWYSYLERK